MNRPPGRDIRWRQRINAQCKEEQIRRQVAKKGSQTTSMKLLKQKLQKKQKVKRAMMQTTTKIRVRKAHLIPQTMTILTANQKSRQ